MQTRTRSRCEHAKPSAEVNVNAKEAFPRVTIDDQIKNARKPLIWLHRVPAHAGMDATRGNTYGEVAMTLFEENAPILLSTSMPEAAKKVVYRGMAVTLFIKPTEAITHTEAQVQLIADSVEAYFEECHDKFRRLKSAVDASTGCMSATGSGSATAARAAACAEFPFFERWLALDTLCARGTAVSGPGAAPDAGKQGKPFLSTKMARDRDTAGKRKRHSSLSSSSTSDTESENSDSESSRPLARKRESGRHCRCVKTIKTSSLSSYDAWYLGVARVLLKTETVRLRDEMQADARMAQIASEERLKKALSRDETIREFLKSGDHAGVMLYMGRK